MERNEMDFSTITSLLGTFYPEESLKQFLEGLGFSEKPKLPRDSTSTYLLRHDLGVEITLTGERYLDNPTRSYPEGAIVLENVRFYSAKNSSFANFKGALPNALQFGLTLKELAAIFGEPAWFDEELAKARWDLSNHAMSADFNEQGRSDVYSFQVPIAED
jgi:hypothetical protein